ncbi:leukocyte elastase inhibitor-like [Cimex lectularius]|uniref:Serpin domain-containing protein n=1 Tax=Cimex lectularius TaxID=79782 RepID=A0A8I6TEY9_CIMLE|nr:leukocyte elastase inhibitor-like [Cimex lectularius]
MRYFSSGVVIFILCSLGLTRGRSWRKKEPGLSFVGEGTNDLSTSILQSEAENNTNLVFSPFGYSAILAVLAEGARSNTRNELVTALKLPEDTFAVRNTYKTVLSNMQDHGVLNKPEFKNWFYVYQNYSVLQAYKSILDENYFTQVKQIATDFNYSAEENQSKPEESSELVSEKGGVDKPLKTDKENTEGQTTTEAVRESEKPLGLEGEKTSNSENNNANHTKTKEVKGNEAVMEDIIARAIKSEMQVEKEMLTALSANRLSTVQETETGEEKSTSRMIIFNALYFRGNWSVPFKAENEKLSTFYKSETEKKQTKFICSEEQFEYGQVPDLDACAVELPYQGGKYSLLLVTPNSRNGLSKLVSNLSGYSLADIGKHLTKKSVNVCIPSFKFYSITRPKAALMKCGIKDIFSEAADLSGISGTKGLYLDDLVQLVTLEVSESSGNYNFLTSSSAEELRQIETRSSVEKFSADRPFLFFLRDRVDNLVVVAGKVHDPVAPDEEA